MVSDHTPGFGLGCLTFQKGSEVVAVGGQAVRAQTLGTRGSDFCNNEDLGDHK